MSGRSKEIPWPRSRAFVIVTFAPRIERRSMTNLWRGPFGAASPASDTGTLRATYPSMFFWIASRFVPLPPRS